LLSFFSSFGPDLCSFSPYLKKSILLTPILCLAFLPFLLFAFFIILFNL
jgi:hypothetical protein